MGLSLSHLLLIAIVAFLVFGAGRLPTLMADLAKGLRAFKDGLKDEDDTPSFPRKLSKTKKKK